MKFVFDFDGVMTTQIEEAHRVKQIFIEELVSRSGLGEERVSAMIERAYQEMHKNPHSHGWRDQGRVSAYANEDLFMENVGLASCLRELADTEHGEYREAREALQNTDAPGYINLSQHAYEKMVQETRQGKVKPVDPKMAPLFKKIIDAGHLITVVSNSSTTRILDLLHQEGLTSAQDHDQDPQYNLRVRGDARKFDLGESQRGFEVNGYRVDTSRPKYERIIREERPNVVVGDVFSLDLSLPIHLSRIEPDTFGGMHVFLREQDYTPAWSNKFMQENNEEHAKLHVINDLSLIAENLGL